MLGGEGDQVERAFMPRQAVRVNVAGCRLGRLLRLISDVDRLAILDRDSQLVDDAGLARVVAEARGRAVEQLGELVEVSRWPLARAWPGSFAARYGPPPRAESRPAARGNGRAR